MTRPAPFTKETSPGPQPLSPNAARSARNWPRQSRRPRCCRQTSCSQRHAAAITPEPPVSPTLWSRRRPRMRTSTSSPPAATLSPQARPRTMPHSSKATPRSPRLPAQRQGPRLGRPAHSQPRHRPRADPQRSRIPEVARRLRANEENECAVKAMTIRDLRNP